MKHIVVLITSALSCSANPISAISFVKAAVQQGHKVDVFFYSDSVADANALSRPLSDELNMYTQYRELARELGIPLLVCNTAAARRGVVPKEEQTDLGYNLEAPFIAAGLTEFAKLSQQADRLVQF